jgi:glycosyltransferase involved in cell wall biosynthesis
MSPLVSILIPCHNAERWIRQCVESALGQTYPHKEVLVLDDGSADGSLPILEEFGAAIRLEQQMNRGANVARNRLTELAQGEWLQYLDADNYLFPEKISRQLNFALSHRPIADTVYSPTRVHCEHSQTERALVIDSDDPYLNFIRWLPFDTTSLLWKRAAVVQVGMWREDQPCCQEHELILRLLMGGARFALLNEPLAVYRDHRQDRISKRDVMRTAKVRMALTDQVERHLQNSALLTDAHRRALAASRAEVGRLAYRTDRDYALQMFRSAVSRGVRWLPPSTACPFSYRLAAFAFGFRAAERLAAWKRWAASLSRRSRD